METILQHFLVRHRFCPLPGIGQLIIQQQPAVLHFTENKLAAPTDSILLKSEINNQPLLMDWIQTEMGVTGDVVHQLLNDFTQSILNLTEEQTRTFGVLGSFLKDAGGRIQFVQATLPEGFAPNVTLKRVIHPNAIHSVRVGDKESTNTEMTEMLNETVETKKSKWWMAAAFFALLSIVGFVLYLNQEGSHASLGNIDPIQAHEEPITFKIAD
jgi:hypothetical protein